MTPSYENVVSRTFLGSIPDLATRLAPALDGMAGDDLTWVFYGSQVLGTAKDTSDYDILVVHDNLSLKPHRVGTTVDGSPVTLYVLSWPDLLSDGSARAFGGYFSLKLFSPFVCWPAGRERVLHASVAEFLAPFAADRARRQGDVQRSRSQILADAYLAFLEIYPGFDSYAVRALRPTDLASPMIWKHQLQVLVDAFEQVGMVRKDDDRYVYTPSAGLLDAEYERAVSAARFWAFGAVCHEADFHFPDLYHRKAQLNVRQRERRSIRPLLSAIASGELESP